jgi:hypothetical protein
MGLLYLKEMITTTTIDTSFQPVIYLIMIGEKMEEEAKRRKEYEALMAEATEENRLSTLRGLMEKYPEEVLNYKVKLVG